MKKDIDYKKYLLILSGIALIRLLLASQQMVYIMPLSAPIDDDLYFNMANSIVKGEWLGEYNFLTLSKYPFFAVYLAALHILKIPYLIGNCLMWVLGGILALICFRPILKENWKKILFFSLFVFNPCTFTTYTLRVYRDGIFPLICTMFFVSMAGWALRLKRDLKYNIAFLILSGIFLGLAFITREDGYWLLPFVIVALAICIVYIVLDKNLKNKLLRIISMTLPGVITAVFVITICSINNKYYGKFTLTDFNSGSFARCYGAMTTIPHEEWNPIVAVPKDVREKMYNECPSFAPFEKYLEEGSINKGYCNRKTGDFQSGSFYWAIRRAAQEMGIYDTPQKAEQFWDKLADEVEALSLKYDDSLPLRSSVTPPIKQEYVKPVINEAFKYMGYIVTWKDMSSYETNLSDSYTGLIDVWQDFLHCKSNYSAIENTAIPYHTNMQKISYHILDGVIYLYKFITLPLLMMAFIGIIKTFLKFKTQSFEKQITAFVLFGFVMMSIFRIFIIAFMEVAAFNIGFYSMYVGAVYPLVVMIFILGTFLLGKE